MCYQTGISVRFAIVFVREGSDEVAAASMYCMYFIDC